METRQTNGQGKNLVDFLRFIDDSLEYSKVLGQGGYGLVLKVKNQGKDYRIKISKRDDSLEREYSLLEDLAKTGAVLKPVKLYDEVSSARMVLGDDSEKYSFFSGTYRFYDGKKGKNAYLTEFMEGKILSDERGKLSDFALRSKLNALLDKIHMAGYEFRENSDFNANNILLGEDRNLYLLDPMMLSRRKGSSLGKTEEEQARVDTMITMCAARVL